MQRKRKGQAAVELALILPVILLILMGLLDLGRLFYFEVAITNAAREGARYGAAHPEKTKAQIIEQAKNEASPISPLDVEVNCQAITSGNNRKVKVDYQFALITPIMQGIVGNQITLSATSSMPTSNYAVTAGCTN